MHCYSNDPVQETSRIDLLKNRTRTLTHRSSGLRQATAELQTCLESWTSNLDFCLNSEIPISTLLNRKLPKTERSRRRDQIFSQQNLHSEDFLARPERGGGVKSHLNAMKCT